MKERRVRLTRYAVLIWKACRGKGNGGIKRIQEIQEELDRRTKVEREAEMLIAECRFDEAMEALSRI